MNLGIHLGQNIKTDEKIFMDLYNSLISHNFKTLIDKPFMAGGNTISGSMASKYPYIWAIQIEINCAITNKKENYDRYKSLLGVLENWLKSI